MHPMTQAMYYKQTLRRQKLPLKVGVGRNNWLDHARCLELQHVLIRFWERSHSPPMHLLIATQYGGYTVDRITFETNQTGSLLLFRDNSFVSLPLDRRLWHKSVLDWSLPSIGTTFNELLCNCQLSHPTLLLLCPFWNVSSFFDTAAMSLLQRAIRGLEADNFCYLDVCTLMRLFGF